MAQLIPLGECVTRGERKLLDHLQGRLPADWVVIGNAMVSSGELTRELDAIVIGDRCIWVIDEKGFGGRITGDEHTWLLADGSARERVLNNVLHAAKMLKGKLSSVDPRLANIWVEGVIVLTADDVEFHIQDPRIGTAVRRLADSEGYFLKAPIARGRPLTENERTLAQRCLCGPNVLDRQKKRFTRIGAYCLIEPVILGSTVQTYRAERDRTKEIVEMKLYDLSALPDPRTRVEERKRAEREFEALRKLRDTDGIVRVAESFQTVEGFGPDLFYFALDLPHGPCLASRLEDPSWSIPSRAVAALRLCEVVNAVHSEGIIHRNLSPSCIHFSRTEADFHLTGFEFSRLALSTLHMEADDLQSGAYAAPEMRESIHNASKASDIYSLGIILYEIFSGQRPFGNRARRPDDTEPPLLLFGGHISESSRTELEAMVQLMIGYLPGHRPHDLADVLGLMANLAKEKCLDSTPPLIARHPLPEGAALGEFTVLSYLGAGGCFHAYRVAKTIDDSREYVAKVVRYPELLETARREFAALGSLEHPNIIRAYDVSIRADAPYQLLETYAPGRTARDQMARGRAEPKQVAEWGAALANALTFMETRTPPIFHGDISPRNIILHEDQPRLVDFGLAHLGDAACDGGIVGTAPYRPPERDSAGASWPASGDVYSLGLVLCELLFGELPYHCDTGHWNKGLIREELFDPKGRASEILLQTLRRSIDPDPSRRFCCAAEFECALIKVPELADLVEPRRWERGVNSYLDQLLKVYNRSVCNAENRGMDSEFARMTYVPTDLDTDLMPDILNHKYALVVLSGNPGDGKTAFLQQLALHLDHGAGILPIHHWVLEKDGWTFDCVLDGSAADSERGLSSHEVLNSVLKPLEAAGERPDLAESIQRTQLLAINDGRLLEYLDDRSEEESWVVHHLNQILGEEQGTPHSQLAIVDLNHRSLATGESNDAFNSVLTSLLQGGWGENRPEEDPWAPCHTCQSAAGCHVRFNVETLLHPKLGPIVRERIGMLLMLVHSRGRVHITMRELRSMLAHVFFGDQNCEEIRSEMGTQTEPDVYGDRANLGPRDSQREKLYFNRLFQAGTNGGRLLSELQDFDPLQVSNPRFDRTLAAALRSPENMEHLFLPVPERIPFLALIADKIHPEDTEALHCSLRRQAFFEGRSNIWEANLGDDYWLEMIPFRRAKEWAENLTNFRRGLRELNRELCHRLCRAISRTDNVPEEFLDRYLAVRTASSSKTDLVVVRLFNLSDFELVWEQAGTRAIALGELPTALLLQFHSDRGLNLEISADLFELLLRFADGYCLGSDELEGIAANLQLFKNRLRAMPATEVCLLHPDLGRFIARQRLNDGTRQIALEVLR